MAEDLAALAEAFDRVVHTGVTAALVAVRGGRTVVDLSAGTDGTGRPFTSARPVFLYSAVKPVTALAAMLAVRDGHLGLDDPVARHWPAFGSGGKQRVTVRQLLAHGAAVPGWREAIDVDTYADLPRAAGLLAAAEPWYPVGEPGEHAYSYGHLVDSLLVHATGDGLVTWFPRAGAASGTGVSLLPGTGDRSAAPLDDPGGSWLAEQSSGTTTMAELLQRPAELLDVRWVNGPAGRALVAPAVTGYGSALDLAWLWSWWAGPDARRLLGPDLHAAATTPQVGGVDHVLDREVRWACGPEVDGTGFGMGGVGGCAGWYEAGQDLAIGLTTPRVGDAERFDPIDEALLALG